MAGPRHEGDAAAVPGAAGGRLGLPHAPPAEPHRPLAGEGAASEPEGGPAAAGGLGCGRWHAMPRALERKLRLFSIL